MTPISLLVQRRYSRNARRSLRAIRQSTNRPLQANERASWKLRLTRNPAASWKHANNCPNTEASLSTRNGPNLCCHLRTSGIIRGSPARARSSMPGYRSTALMQLTRLPSLAPRLGIAHDATRNSTRALERRCTDRRLSGHGKEQISAIIGLRSEKTTKQRSQPGCRDQDRRPRAVHDRGRPLPTASATGSRIRVQDRDGARAPARRLVEGFQILHESWTETVEQDVRHGSEPISLSRGKVDRHRGARGAFPSPFGGADIRHGRRSRGAGSSGNLQGI